jgi:transposase
MTDTEDSEQIEIDVKAHRRVIRRKRYRKTCTCPGCYTITAPTPPKLIPKSLLGTSVWVEVLLAKYFNHQPTERLLTSWKLLGLDLAASTVNAGLERLQPLFTPIYQALQERNRLSAYQQADETRWLVFVEKEGKQGHRWWLWVFNGIDTVVYVLDPYRSHDVPEGHFSAGVGVVLMVDRLASYKAMAPVKAGLILLAFCWAHVRRDFIGVAKGFPELKPWAIEWLKRIRQAYRCNRERVPHEEHTPEFAAADVQLRQVMDEMKAKAAEELADPKLRLPCRKVLVSLQEHWTGLTRFVDDARIPMDNNASERSLRGAALGRKNYYGSGAEWSGQLAMMLFSVFATLQKWNLNPRSWLRWYLDACAVAGGKAPSDVQPFLPWTMTEEQRRTMADPMRTQDRQEPSDSS